MILLSHQRNSQRIFPVIFRIRFAALTRNIRHRRGGKVDIKMPLFRDVNTPEYLRLDSAEKTAAAVQNAMESPHIPFAVSAASLSGANGVKPEM